jgi:hypothetical protein
VAWRAALLVLVLLATTVAAQGDPAPGIPPDGPAGPITSLLAIKTVAKVGFSVTTQVVSVDKVDCPNCESATVPADFWVKDAVSRVRVHVPVTHQARFNVKKQAFVPAVGFQVVVQGRIEELHGERYIEMKRFGEVGHMGPTVDALAVANGKVAPDSYVWLANSTILNVGRWDDGDYSFDIRSPLGGPLIHIELSPPFNGQLRIPHKGEAVRPYGMVRFDPDHDWYEIHPVRCWQPDECVPPAADFVRNGPPEGTPETGGSYVEGGPTPRVLPIEGAPANSTGPLELTLRSPDDPFVALGGSLDIVFDLANLGPNQQDVTLEASGDPSGWAVEWNRLDVSVSPLGSKEVRIHVQAPAAGSDGDQAAITLHATSSVGQAKYAIDVTLSGEAGASHGARIGPLMPLLGIGIAVLVARRCRP